MAMLPFCGYNMGDYFGHWIKMGEKAKKAPKVFSANWFRTDEDGKFLWPGFGDNIRVLKWVIDRTKGKARARETPLGLVPAYEDLDLTGLNFPRDKFDKAFEINKDEWRKEIADIEEFFKKFGSKMPQAIWDEFNGLKKRFGF